MPGNHLVYLLYPMLFIFDLDGTISDSYPGIERGFRHALTKMNHPESTRSGFQEFIGAPLPNAFSMLLDIPVEDTKNAVDYFREYYSVHGWKENELYTGIHPLLVKLRDEGHVLAVATNKPTVFAEKILIHFEIHELFHLIVGQELGYTPAKKSELIRKVLTELKHPEAVYIGDSIFDVHAGKECQMPVVAVGYGFGSEHELKNSSPDYYAHTVHELNQCLVDLAKK